MTLSRNELIKLLQTFPSPNGEEDCPVSVEIRPGQWTTVPIIGIRNDGVTGIALTLRIPDER
jgi:hypothetical protein